MLSRGNAVFEEMYRIGHDWEKAREERRQRKQEIIDTKGWDSEELKAWYAEDEAAKFPFSQGANKAYRAWASSVGDCAARTTSRLALASLTRPTAVSRSAL